MTLESLPVIDVYIAFLPYDHFGYTLNNAFENPLPASGASNTYWTNCSPYLLDFTTRAGKQHFLDRVEAGTLIMTVNGRDGFFVNGTLNGTGTVLNARSVIVVTATWSGTTYPIFWGIVDEVDEIVLDAVNVNFRISATDQLKQLSLRHMASTNFWEQYAHATTATNWYRCTAENSTTITAFATTSTVATYTAINTFSVGQAISIGGLATGYGANQIHVAVASVITTSGVQTGFTVAGTYTATSVITGTGVAYRTEIKDQIGTQNGSYLGGIVAFPQYGAMIYDPDGCVDITNGTTHVTGYMDFGVFSTPMGAFDFWVLGQGLANNSGAGGGTSTINTFFVNIGGTPYVALLSVDTNGHATISITGHGTATSSNPINDGFWHHIGFLVKSGNAYLYCDGVFTAIYSGGSATGWTSTSGSHFTVGLPQNSILYPAPAYYDEIVLSNTSNGATTQTLILDRYRAGTLLQLPTNPTQASVLSGDRIAEVLCLAGYGHIQAGVIYLNNNQYFINDSATQWAAGVSTNGYTNVEPYYWDTPVTGSTALDIIGQITDTDIGTFLQDPDGTFQFYNQNYYGTWAWNPVTKTGTWTLNGPGYVTPTGDHVWTDDMTSTYNYYGPSLQVIRDDADTWTTVKVTPQAGIDQLYENTSAEPQYGYATLVKSSTVHPTLDAALSTANYLGYLSQSPLPRVANVELRSETNSGANLTAMLGTQIGDVVQFIRTPPNADSAGTVSIDMVVESISHDFAADPGYWHTSFTLTPYPVRA